MYQFLVILCSLCFLTFGVGCIFLSVAMLRWERMGNRPLKTGGNSKKAKPTEPGLIISDLDL